MSTLPPLTHHEILTLVEPFTRAGRAPDLAASDRQARRLAFRAVDHAASAELPALHETLSLDNPERGRWRLTRTLRAADGLAATLQAEGDEPAQLLEQVQAVPAPRQWRQQGGVQAAFSHRVAHRAGTTAPAEGPPLVLQRAEARLPGGLRLLMGVSRVSGYPAELELLRPDGPGGPDAAGADAIVTKLPADLLAVLGRPWERLTTVRRGWLSSVRLRGEEPRRSRDAETRFTRTVEHLARTLAEPPARFHERHLRARWAVSLRGSVPLMIGVALAGTALWLQRQGATHQWALGLLANMAPPLLMGLFFMRREMPRIALPHVPMRPRDDAWRTHHG